MTVAPTAESRLRTTGFSLPKALSGFVILAGILYIGVAVWSSILYRFKFPLLDTYDVYQDFLSGDIGIAYFLTLRNGHFAFSTLLVQYLDFISPMAPNSLAVTISLLSLFVALAGVVYLNARSFTRLDVASFSILVFVFLLFNPQRHNDLYWGFKVHDSFMLAGAIWLGALALATPERSSRGWQVAEAAAMAFFAFLAGSAAAGGFILCLAILFFAMLLRFRWSLLAPLTVALACGAVVFRANLLPISVDAGAMTERVDVSLGERIASGVLAAVGSLGNYPVSMMFGPADIAQNGLRVAVGAVGVLLFLAAAVGLFLSVRKSGDRRRQQILAWNISLMAGAAGMLLAITVVRVSRSSVDALMAFPRFLTWSGLFWTAAACATAILLMPLRRSSLIVAAAAVVLVVAYAIVMDEGVQRARFVDRLYQARTVGYSAAYPERPPLGPNLGADGIAETLADYRARTGAILAFDPKESVVRAPSCLGAALHVFPQTDPQTLSVRLMTRGCLDLTEAYLVSDDRLVGASLWPSSVPVPRGFLAALRGLYQDSRLPDGPAAGVEFAFTLPGALTQVTLDAYGRGKNGKLVKLGCVRNCPGS